MPFRSTLPMAGDPGASRPGGAPPATVLVVTLLAGVAMVLGAVVALAMLTDVVALLIAFAVLMTASGLVMAAAYGVLHEEEASDR
jgi:zinc transporter ZupT